MPRPPRRARPDVRRWWKLSWPGRLERHELHWLIVGLGACILLFVFVRLAGEVLEGETMAFDTKIMSASNNAVFNKTLPIASEATRKFVAR